MYSDVPGLLGSQLSYPHWFPFYGQSQWDSSSLAS
jgi:hypothetical protein